ncbi:hypothetical protein, partial [Morganella morganii]|uniref:hypothetical protein n=1 Tax=Morganella morganii TaxID=582 RepID=UPI001953AD0A
VQESSIALAMGSGEAVVLFNDAGFPSEILIASVALAGAVYALTKHKVRAACLVRGDNPDTRVSD